MQPGKLKILVIDDSQEIREFLRNSVLEPAGYQTFLASTGREGLALAERIEPDLVLLDYELPDLNGIEILHALDDAGLTLPVILITSYGSESVAVDVFRLGVRDYVPKPFTIQEITEAITHVLNNVRIEEQRDALLTDLQRTNDQLNRRLQELNTLYRVSKSVTMLRGNDKLLERIVSAALYLTGTEAGALVLRNTKTGKASVQVAKQRAGESANGVDVANMTKIPIEIANRTLGTLMVSRGENDPPLDEDAQQLLGMLADYAAIAIENNRLLREIEQQRQREKKQLRTLFEHYVAPPVVDQILKRPESVKPGGQRQTISVLFADLRGFTTFSSQSSPETLMTVLNRHIATAAEQILKEKGTLDKFMGDEVMAFFNAPLPQEAYARRAVRAAIRIIEATRNLHDQTPEQHRLEFGIGISTGDAIVGNVGMSHLVNFTVVGATVNKAHTLQEAAPPGTILICQQTYKQVKDFVKAEEVHIQRKGLGEAESVYQIRLSDRT